MIAKPALGAHVCLRCRFRLSGGIASPLSTPKILTQRIRASRQQHNEAWSNASEQSNSDATSTPLQGESKDSGDVPSTSLGLPQRLRPKKIAIEPRSQHADLGNSEESKLSTTELHHGLAFRIRAVKTDRSLDRPQRSVPLSVRRVFMAQDEQRQRFTTTKRRGGIPRLHSQGFTDGHSRKLERLTQLPEGAVIAESPGKPKHLEFPGRLNNWKSHTLRNNDRNLGMQVLGRPSEVIVLKDAKVRFIPKGPLHDEDELVVVHEVDILKRLEEERGIVGREEVERNIQELEPAERSKIVSWEELDAIRQRLHDGFTIFQLTGYMSSIEEQQAEELRQKSYQDTPDLTTLQSRWMPGRSESGDEFEESSLRGYRSDAMTPKHRLVLRLMRSCWNLEEQETAESIGEMELTLRETHLELLVNARGRRHPVIKAVSDSLHEEEGEMIEAFRSRRVIRITAKKQRCDEIAEAIRNLLKSVHCLEIDPTVLISSQSKLTTGPKKQKHDGFKVEELESLAQLTNTEIKRLSTKKLAIFCFNWDNETRRSNVVDIARRQLLSSSDVADHALNLQALECINDAPIALRYEGTSGLSWRDRLQSWIRLTSPTSKTPETPQDSQDTSKSLLIKPKMFGKVNQNQTESQPSDRLWGESKLVSLIKFGHVIHKVSDSNIDMISTRENIRTSGTKFVPTTHNLSRLLKTFEGNFQSIEPTVVLKLLPSPWGVLGASALNSCPPIEIRLKIDAPTKSLKLSHVLAMTERTNSDVMMPDRAIDLRFQQTSMSSLKATDEQWLPQITDFLEASQLRLPHAQITTPPGLKIPISRSLCKQSSEADIVFSGTDHAEVDYLITGLEYRRTLSFKFEDWRLRYTSIESGKIDGQRGELSLHPIHIGKRGRRVQAPSVGYLKWHEKASRKFVETAYHLADALEDVQTPLVRQHSTPTSVTGISSKGTKSRPFKYFEKAIDFKEDPFKYEEGISVQEAGHGAEQDAEGEELELEGTEWEDAFDVIGSVGSVLFDH